MTGDAGRLDRALDVLSRLRTTPDRLSRFRSLLFSERVKYDGHQPGLVDQALADTGRRLGNRDQSDQDAALERFECAIALHGRFTATRLVGDLAAAIREMRTALRRDSGTSRPMQELLASWLTERHRLTQSADDSRAAAAILAALHSASRKHGAGLNR